MGQRLISVQHRLSDNSTLLDFFSASSIPVPAQRDNKSCDFTADTTRTVRAQLVTGTVMTHLVHVHIKPVEGSTVMDVGETEHVETAGGVRKVQADAHTVTVVYSDEYLTRVCIHYQEILPQREQSA